MILNTKEKLIKYIINDRDMDGWSEIPFGGRYRMAVGIWVEVRFHPGWKTGEWNSKYVELTNFTQVAIAK